MQFKRSLLLFTLATLLLSPSTLLARNFALGADISGTTELEAQGIKPFNNDGASHR